MNANGKSMLFRGRLVGLEELIDGIDRVSVENVKDFADSYLDLSASSLSLVGNII
jgi:predicted Zn-dependent peptidase